MKNLFNSIITLLLFTSTCFSQTIPIGSPINSGYDEFNPCISGDGRTLIYEQLYQNDTKPYAYITYQKNGTWSNPEKIEGANTEVANMNNSGYFLNQAGNLILFHSSRYGGIGNSDIWIIEQNITGNWAAPKNLGKPINSTLHDAFPSLSPDGKYLFFTRLGNDTTTNGNKCGKIFMAERAGAGRWKTPIELPSSINKSCECDGKLLSDNKTFLFSSMRAGGKGGYDVYKSIKKNDGSWSEAVPYTFINTDKDDQSVSVPAGGTLIYYSAPGNSGKLDITRSVIPNDLKPETVTLLQGKVKNGANNLPLTPKVSVTDPATNETYTYYGAKDGSYVALVPQDKEYDVSILGSQGGFNFYSFFVSGKSPQEYQEIAKDYKLTPFKTGISFPLNNMSFLNNTDTLNENGNPELFRLLILLKSHPTLSIEVGVHTIGVVTNGIKQPGLTGSYIDSSQTYIDSTGTELPLLKTIYTSDNTKAQAKAILDALIARGIPAERVKPVGYGDKQPLSPAPSNPKLNKRIEVKILRE